MNNFDNFCHRGLQHPGNTGQKTSTSNKDEEELNSNFMINSIQNLQTKPIKLFKLDIRTFIVPDLLYTPAAS